jgi:hypothetical protein
MRRGFCDEVLMPAYPIAQNLKSCSFIDWIEKMDEYLTIVATSIYSFLL